MSLLKCSASKFKVSVTYEEYPCISGAERERESELATVQIITCEHFIMLICGFEELSVQLNLNFCYVIQQLIVPFLFPIINHDEAKWVERTRNW